MANVIRKVSPKENLAFYRDRARGFSRSLRVTSTLDLFAKPGLLNKTIRQWMSTHPFLQAKAAITDGENYFVLDERLDGSRWTEDSSGLENVKYLAVDWEKLSDREDRSAFFDDLAWLVCERELAEEFDVYNKLLWRLVFLEVATDSDGYEYDISLVIHHSISEGRNSHMILLQLLDLIEYFWTLDAATPKKQLKIYEAIPSVEEVFFNNVDSSKYNNVRMKNLPFVKRANYIDADEAKKSPAKQYKWAELMSNEYVYNMGYENDSIVKRPLIRVGELVKDSESVCIKSRRFTFSEEETKLSVQKCKSEQTTVTLALVNLLAISLRKLSFICSQQAKSEESNKPTQTNTYVAITLRQLEPTWKDFKASDEYLDQLVMGYHISGTFISLEHLKNLDTSQLDDPKNFWDGCRSSGRHLKEIIDGREIYFPMPIRQRLPGECDSTQNASNLGIVPGKLADKYAMSPRTSFHVKKAYLEVQLSNLEADNVGPLALYGSTCNGAMNISFFYNSHLLSHARVDKVIEIFLSDYYRKLIN